MSADRLSARLREVASGGETAILPYLVAGFPDRAGFAGRLVHVGAHVPVLEVGLPFTDPTADGPVIAAAAQQALRDGVQLGWLLDVVRQVRTDLHALPVLMSYFNPLLAHGIERPLDGLARAGFAGLIVPDVPFEESEELRAACAARALALVPLVTPLTPRLRAARLAEAGGGFLYAVTRTGTTGARAEPGALAAYLDGLRAVSPLPVCAGFGVREPAQVCALRPHCDGLIVGTALVERLARGEDPLPFLQSLIEAARAAGEPS